MGRYNIRESLRESSPATNDKRQVVMYVTSIKDYLLFYEKIVNWLSTA